MAPGSLLIQKKFAFSDRELVAQITENPYLQYFIGLPEYQDNTDRIEVEREFSVEKHSYGLGLVTTRLEGTQLTSIALSVFVANLFKMQRKILCALLQLWSFCPESTGWMTAKAA